MKSLNSRTLVLASISSLALVCTLQASAQTSSTTAEPVRVVNSTKSPVPTVAQGTTTISGNVNVTNNPLPVTGSVSITNNSVPVNVTNAPLGVSGTVAVSNLPLDANGNVLVSVAPDTTQYKYLSIVATSCFPAQGILDWCVNSVNLLPIEQTLTTLSGQGYALFSVTPSDNYSPGGNAGVAALTYTLRAPVAGTHKKASPVH